MSIALVKDGALVQRSAARRTVPKTYVAARRTPSAACTESAIGLNSVCRGNFRDRVWRPECKRRIGAPITIAGAFFVSAFSCNGGCAWETFGSAGFLFLGSPTCVQLPPNRLATIDVVFN